MMRLCLQVCCGSSANRCTAQEYASTCWTTIIYSTSSCCRCISPRTCCVSWSTGGSSRPTGTTTAQSEPVRRWSVEATTSTTRYNRRSFTTRRKIRRATSCKRVRRTASCSVRSIVEFIKWRSLFRNLKEGAGGSGDISGVHFQQCSNISIFFRIKY